jgi:hypothetical protein
LTVLPSVQVQIKVKVRVGGTAPAPVARILIGKALLDELDDAARSFGQAVAESTHAQPPPRAMARWNWYYHLGIIAQLLALDPVLPRQRAFEALAAWLDEPDAGGLDAEARRDAVLATAPLWDDAEWLGRARELGRARARHAPQLDGSTNIVRSELLRVLGESDAAWDPELSGVEQAGFYLEYEGPHLLWFAAFAQRCRNAGVDALGVLRGAARRLDEELGDGELRVVKDVGEAAWLYVPGDGGAALECRGRIRGDGRERTIRALDVVAWPHFRTAWDQLEPIARGLAEISTFKHLPARKELDAIRVDPEAEIRIVVECSEGVAIADEALRSQQARLDAGAEWLRARGSKLKCKLRIVAEQR